MLTVVAVFFFFLRLIQVLRTEKARAADFSRQTICYSLSGGSPFTREAFRSILSSFFLVIFFGCVRRIFFFSTR